MSEKRRDNKNRILRSGESQRKDGRYTYKYIDHRGKPQFVYSWRLVPTDKFPSGKRDDISLREKEKAIRRDIEDGINISDNKMTVHQLCSKCISQRNIRRTSRKSYQRMLNNLEKDELGSYAVKNVKMSDAKDWVMRMKEKGLSYVTVTHDKQILRSSFQMAVQDDYIRKNPFEFRLSTVMENKKKSIDPLTPEQEKALFSFVYNDNTYCKYYDELIILLNTGLWISELCGLTESDIDIDKRLINIDHQLLRDSSGYYIEKLKTSSGVRIIPMTPPVLQEFKNVLVDRVRVESVEIDGYSDFLFFNKCGLPKVGNTYLQMLYNLVAKYNKKNDDGLLGNITPHTFRHTFCTKLANAGMNPKALQHIMGRSDINMTLNYYAHATFDSAKSEMMRLCDAL